MREAQVLESDSDSDDSGPVFGGRSDDEGALLNPYFLVAPCVLWQPTIGAGTRKMLIFGARFVSYAKVTRHHTVSV